MKRIRLVIAAVMLSCALWCSVVAIAQDREETAPPPPAEDTPDDAEADGPGKVKVLEFGELDIASRSKSPQLVYFLARLRAEFDRPKLPHRSFIPELVRSTKGSAL